MKKLLTILCLVLLVSLSTEVSLSQSNQEDCDLLCQLGQSQSSQPQPQTKTQNEKIQTPREDLPEYQYEVPSHRIVKNGGMTFEIGSNDPFTGVSIHYHENGQPEEKTYYKNGREIRKEFFYPQRTIHMIETFTDGVGGNKVQVFDEEGKDISNDLYLTLWDNGSIKSRGNYTNGKKEGVWEEFDLSGNSLKRTYWENNLLIPTTDFESIVLRVNVPNRVNSNEPYTGIIRFKEGKYSGVILQQFKDGKPEGMSERYNKNGKLINYCSFEKGLSYNFGSKYIQERVFEYPEGSFCEGIHENGQKSYENYYVEENGVTSLKYISYYENGQTTSQGQNIYVMKDGEYTWVNNGVFMSFYENGQVRSDVVYDKGVVVSGMRFDETGMDISNGEGMGVEGYPERKGFFSNGLQEGRWEDEYGGFMNYKKGKLEGPSVHLFWENCTHEIGSYKNNNKEGTWIKYNFCKEDDDPSEVLYYENGKLVER